MITIFNTRFAEALIGSLDGSLETVVKLILIPETIPCKGHENLKARKLKEFIKAVSTVQLLEWIHMVKGFWTFGFWTFTFL